MAKRQRQSLVDLDTFPHQHIMPRELAGYLRCDTRTVLNMIYAGSLFAYRVGRNYRIPIGEVRRVFPVKQHLDTSRYKPSIATAATDIQSKSLV